MTPPNLLKSGPNSSSHLARASSYFGKRLGSPAMAMFLTAAVLIAPLVFATDAWESWFSAGVLIIAALMTAGIGVLFIMLGATWDTSFNRSPSS